MVCSYSDIMVASCACSSELANEMGDTEESTCPILAGELFIMALSHRARHVLVSLSQLNFLGGKAVSPNGIVKRD